MWKKDDEEEGPSLVPFFSPSVALSTSLPRPLPRLLPRPSAEDSNNRLSRHKCLRESILAAQFYLEERVLPECVRCRLRSRQDRELFLRTEKRGGKNGYKAKKDFFMKERTVRRKKERQWRKRERWREKKNKKANGISRRKKGIMFI